MTNLTINNKIELDTNFGTTSIVDFQLDIRDYSEENEECFYANINVVFEKDNLWHTFYDNGFDDRSKFSRQVEEVTKKAIQQQMPELKNAEIRMSEQGMQGENFMSMDVHFFTKPINGEKFGRVDEEKQTQVFGKIFRGEV